MPRLSSPTGWKMYTAPKRADTRSLTTFSICLSSLCINHNFSSQRQLELISVILSLTGLFAGNDLLPVHHQYDEMFPCDSEAVCHYVGR